MQISVLRAAVSISELLFFPQVVTEVICTLSFSLFLCCLIRLQFSNVISDFTYL
uniref:Uncharacterized protein n=1 Tax=Arundo donax TaxID=35708 RepID=A0A0A9CCJ4_ARUDO